MANGVAAQRETSSTPSGGGSAASGRRFTLLPTPWWAHRDHNPLGGRSLPRSLFGLSWRVSAPDQVWLCLLAVAVALLDTAPIEVQRRMVNHAIKESGLRSILLLAATYAGIVLVQGLIKLLSNLYRSWVSEHSVRILRTFISAVHNAHAGTPADAEQQGTEVSMIVAESEPIGAFVGESFSEPLLQAGIIVFVVGYLIYLQPVISLVLLAVYVPQLVFVPLIQRAINERAQARIATLREASAGVIDNEHSATIVQDQEDRFAKVFHLNMGVYKLKYSMNFLMNLCHQLGIAAILAVGGWFVVIGKTEIGTVVAFISGLRTVKDPWDDLTTWFQTCMVSIARYRLLTETLDGSIEPRREAEP